VRFRLAWVIATLCACRSAEPPKALEVELAGCREWRAGPRCEVGLDEPLSFFVRTTTVAAFLDGVPLRIRDAHVVQNGLGFHLSVRPGTLTVRAPGSGEWSLVLAPHQANEALLEIARMRRRGERLAAEEKLAELGAIEGAAGQRGRNALAAGQIEDAVRELEAAVEEDRRLGKKLTELSDRLALAHTFLNHRYPESAARAQLDALAPLASEYAEAAADVDYTGAVLASEYRDVRRGLEHARRLMERAERLDREDMLDAREILTNLLVIAGRWPEVQVEAKGLQSAMHDQLSPCKAAELWSNIGWFRLLGSRQAPKLFKAAPSEELAQAAALYRTACDRPLLLANAELNLAWAALFEGRNTEAREGLARARSAVAAPDLRTMMHFLHLEAEVLLAEQKAKEALEILDRLRVLAHTAGATEILWQAHLGRGRALSFLGANDEAIASYRESERLLGQLAKRVPLGEGRDALLFDRSEGSIRLVTLLIEAKRFDEAILAIRESRLAAVDWARGLIGGEPDATRETKLQKLREARAALDKAARAEWMRPTNEAQKLRLEREEAIAASKRMLDEVFGESLHANGLPQSVLPLGPAEAAVYAHPTEGGIVAIVRTATMLHVESVSITGGTLPGLKDSGTALLQAARVHFYVHPALESLDWPLLTRGTSIFHADLRALRARATNTVLIAADPARALPNARRESVELAEHLKARGYAVTLLEDADRAAFFDALGRPLELFHYSGHGVQEGHDGLEAGFPLRDRQRFTVVDVLAANAGPRRVVLAACELGQHSAAAGLSMAQAFLLAGADEVVAAVRPVDDAATAAWVKAFYTETSTRSSDVAFRHWVAN
jgi:hypothetical protein